MTENSAVASSYDSGLAPALYDGLVATMFSPLGGIGRLRDQALDLIGDLNGRDVLELGCGTGAITEKLAQRGARVTAVDGSQAMLGRAARRAPGATFRHGRLEALGDLGTFDVVLCAFVLHELPADLRLMLFRRIHLMLKLGGHLAILDHATPKQGVFAKVWRGFLSKLEPPSVADCIGKGYDGDLTASGYRVTAARSLAKGCAQFLTAVSA